MKLDRSLSRVPILHDGITYKFIRFGAKHSICISHKSPYFLLKSNFAISTVPTPTQFCLYVTYKVTKKSRLEKNTLNFEIFLYSYKKKKLERLLA